MCSLMMRSIWISIFAIGCAANGADHSITAPPPDGDASRAIIEADIIQIDSGRLYAMSKLGSLSIVDISQPGRLALLGQTQLAGEPFEMYRRGSLLIAM